MTKLDKIEQDIASLSKAELHKLVDWFAEYHAEVWDKQIAADSETGKLDELAQKALADHKAGLSEML